MVPSELQLESNMLYFSKLGAAGLKDAEWPNRTLVNLIFIIKGVT